MLCVDRKINQTSESSHTDEYDIDFEILSKSRRWCFRYFFIFFYDYFGSFILLDSWSRTMMTDWVFLT